MSQPCSIHHEFAVTQYTPGECAQWSLGNCIQSKYVSQLTRDPFTLITQWGMRSIFHSE